MSDITDLLADIRSCRSALVGVNSRAEAVEWCAEADRLLLEALIELVKRTPAAERSRLVRLD
jgi:hypothetical protein